MQSIFEFVSSLVSSIKKTDVAATIAALLEELTDQTIPLFQKFKDAGLFVGNHRYKSQWAIKRMAVFAVKTKRPNTGFVDVISAILAVLPAQVTKLGQLATGNGTEIVVSGITYKTATLLQLIDNLKFFTSYSRKVLMILAYHEFPENSGKKPPYSNATMARLEEEFDQYCRLCAVLLASGNSLDQILNRIPNVLVDADGIGLAVNGHVVQPITMGFAPSRFNIIWRIRTAIADAQVTYYEECKAEAQLLELLLVNLKATAAGTPGNAAIEKQIAYHESRLMKLTNHILEIENEYA